jgi:apolipoprotein N-acyltransferase
VKVRAGGVVLPCLGAGLLLALTLPPWGLWPLGFVGTGILFWRLGGLGLRSRLLGGWVAGLGCFGPGLAWAQTFNWYGAVVLIVVEALFMAAAAACVPPRRGRLPAFVGAFTLLEAARATWPFGGLPMGGVYLGQAGGPLLGTARLGGPLLIDALVWAGGAAGSLAVGALFARPGYPLRELPELAALSRLGPTLGPGTPSAEPRWRARQGVAAAVIAIVVIAVVLVSDHVPDGGGAVGTLRVAAVQGGGRRGVHVGTVAPGSVLDAQLKATEPLARPGADRVALVVWPEDVLSLSTPLARAPQAVVMSELALALRTTVLAGITRAVSKTAFVNAVVAWGPDGRVVGTYEKVHRVPFGEYVPFRAFFSHLANLSGVPLDAVPGHSDGLLRTPAAPLGVLVSFEIFFADRGRAPTRAGAELLVAPTNTTSYSSGQVPGQSVAAARVQAVENGRDLVQAAPTGYSTILDHRGTVLAQSVLGARQLVVADVALRRGTTPYVLWGDLPVLVLAGLLLLAGWLGAGAGRGWDRYW